ncbi:glycerophosphodiester phosphodiesterase [Pseudobacteriovorax antillogorgiicola]|uniref:glycerophosphodiester phosphodiesterase n=1 Tax=Pseudobacteriovorax antillogorgiicola TaxID=1513793 RepID=A0A1Y6CPS6_9BACT|nr:glycerophosphodiester phosphodiesterase [Pseudobacteriovorax antillogorgiicola]TCS46953.1 glycerophosphoryl diester phosphodiesterase [Pseudobacteriovorax antillogorgiicola]SMF64526.1 glycerophosphoryl diester phosphodiesterase [Pseudobacteriovorax antillogorgiicola]
MKFRWKLLCLLLGFTGANSHLHAGKVEDFKKPLVIAHRGASGYLPEHTLAAYSIAVLQGADFIEPDLVMTKDGHLVARHDNLLDLSTDVAQRPEFADRKTTKIVDGIELTGWFSEDFTLAEMKTLRAVERIPDIRPDNTRFDGMFEVPTFEEIIKLAKSLSTVTGRTIGLYPETKHPSHFDRLGLSMEEPLVKLLHSNGYKGPTAPVFIQSFEVSNLKDLNRMTEIPLVQLLWIEGSPYDAELEQSGLTYDKMATAKGLREIARYADGVGPEKYYFILPRDEEGRLNVENDTGFVKKAHDAGLVIHPYTFRAENRYLPSDLQSAENQPNQLGDAVSEMKLFLSLGIDGFFTDHPDLGVKAKAQFLSK